MRTSCAMMASSVTPPTEDKGAVEAGGAAISIRGCLSLSCAALYQTVVASMAHMKVK